VRALAFQLAGDSRSAAAEFQRIIDHRGIAITSPLYPLADVQLARAHAHAGELAKARAAYESFLKLWEHADPDIPILTAARAEYATVAGGSAPPSR
jgi:eukaryotic-like serine/threonine-protein kinase